MREESIAKGETVESDWEAFAEREERIQEECAKRGEKFSPEDDWSLSGRQAGGKARAQAKAASRKAQYPPEAIVKSLNIPGNAGLKRTRPNGIDRKRNNGRENDIWKGSNGKNGKTSRRREKAGE